MLIYSFFGVFYFVSSIKRIGGLWRIGAGLPQLEPKGSERGSVPDPLRGNATPYRGCVRVFGRFFFYVRGQESACPFMARLVLKSQGGGGSHGASINPRWGGTPPLVGVLHGINSKA